MKYKLLASASVIGCGCMVMLIWAWRSGDGVLVATMAIALVLICGVGSLPIFFNVQGRKSEKPPSETITVKQD